MDTQLSNQTQEELEAALLEGAAPISEEGLELQRRYHQLKSDIAPAEAEMKAIKELLLGEMHDKGVNTLTYKGVPVAAEVTSFRTKVDLPGIVAEFPEVEAKYVSKSISKRFDAKKVVS